MKKRIRILAIGILGALVSCSADEPQEPVENVTRLYDYSLAVRSIYVGFSVGVNDVQLVAESGASFSSIFPLTPLLKHGKNDVYLRVDPLPLKNGKMHEQQMIELELRVQALEGSKFQITRVVRLKLDPKTQALVSVPAVDKPGLDHIKIAPEPVILPKTDGQAAGYQFTIQLNEDEFYTVPYAKGQPMKVSQALEAEVAAKIRSLFDLMQDRDADALVDEYRLPFRHYALSYPGAYGTTAESFARELGFIADWENDDTQYVLDFSGAKLRLEANGLLVGYDDVLTSHDKQNIGESTYIMWFMRDQKGELQLAR